MRRPGTLGTEPRHTCGTSLESSMLSRPYDEFNLVQELSGSTPTANLLTERGIDETFTRTDAGGTSSFLVDALGSTLELADGSGALRTPLHV